MPDTTSRSVPHTPSAKLFTNTAPSERGGSGMSSTRAELAIPGATVRARITLFRHWNVRGCGSPHSHGNVRSGNASRRKKFPRWNQPRFSPLVRPHADAALHYADAAGDPAEWDQWNRSGASFGPLPKD